MGTPPFQVMHATWAHDGDALRRIREVVFVYEQHVPIDLERDGLDPECDHVLARDAAGHPIGAGRLTAERSIGRLAVLRAWRQRGVGGAMLAALVALARARGWPDVTLHAQADAIGFYERFGFIGEGPEFMEAGIRHRQMRLVLAPPLDA